MKFQMAAAVSLPIACVCFTQAIVLFGCPSVPDTGDGNSLAASGGGGGQAEGGGGGTNVLPDAGSSGGGGQDAGIPPPAILSFTATPTQLPAGGGVVTLAWDVTGATELSIDQGVGSVAVAGRFSVSVRIAASTTWTLSASGPGGTAMMAASATVAPTLTVHGRVLDVTRLPAAGVPVVITGQPSVNTDTDGTFTIHGVIPPYEIAVVDPSAKIGTVYQGLSQPSPVVILWKSTPTNRSALLAGQVTGGKAPYCTTQTGGTVCTAVFFESPEASGLAWTSLTGNYSMTTRWPNVTTTTGVLHAFEFQFSTSGGYPTGYLGYGEVSGLTVATGGSFTRGIALSAVSTLTIAGTAMPSAGYTVDRKQLILHLTAPTHRGLSLANDTTSNVGFTFVGPMIRNSTFTLAVRAADANGTTVTTYHPGIHATTMTLDVAIPAGPALILPVNRASGLGLLTTFSWQAYANGIHLFVATPSNSSDPTFAVFTAGTTASIPDLRRIGLALPSFAQYNWEVLGFAPVSSIDEMAGATGSSIVLHTTESEYSWGNSAAYSFTTQ